MFVSVFPLPTVPGVSSHRLCRRPNNISRNASPARAGRGYTLEGQETRVSIGAVQSRLMTCRWSVTVARVIWSCDNSVALALIIKHKSFLLVPVKLDEAAASGGKSLVPLRIF